MFIKFNEFRHVIPYSAPLLLFALVTAAPGQEISTSVTIAGPDEPGKRMYVTGRVLASDGKTPMPGYKIEIYHTDIKGLYSNTGSGHRLTGFVRTGENGEFSYSTIKPEPYPANNVPAHVHYIVTGPKNFEQTFELLFEGDSRISDRTRQRAQRSGDFFAIRKLEKNKKGVLTCVHDLILRRPPGTN